LKISEKQSELPIFGATTWWQHVPARPRHWITRKACTQGVYQGARCWA